MNAEPLHEQLRLAELSLRDIRASLVEMPADADLLRLLPLAEAEVARLRREVEEVAR